MMSALGGTGAALCIFSWDTVQVGSYSHIQPRCGQRKRAPQLGGRELVSKATPGPCMAPHHLAGAGQRGRRCNQDRYQRRRQAHGSFLQSNRGEDKFELTV